MELKPGIKYGHGKNARVISRLNNGRVYYHLDDGSFKNCLITTFQAWLSNEAGRRTVSKIYDVSFFLEGKRHNAHRGIETKKAAHEIADELIANAKLDIEVEITEYKTTRTKICRT